MCLELRLMGEKKTKEGLYDVYYHGNCCHGGPLVVPLIRPRVATVYSVAIRSSFIGCGCWEVGSKPPTEHQTVLVGMALSSPLTQRGLFWCGFNPHQNNPQQKLI
jgi:hypothetical protein